MLPRERAREAHGGWDKEGMIKRKEKMKAMIPATEKALFERQLDLRLLGTWGRHFYD